MSTKSCKTAREIFGLTQAKKAEIFPVAKRTLENWEMGKHPPNCMYITIINYYLKDKFEK